MREFRKFNPLLIPRPRRAACAARAAIWCAVMLCGVNASAIDRIRIIDSDLNVIDGKLIHLSETELRFFDEQRRPQTLDADKVVRITARDANPGAITDALVHLADGQVIAGRLLESDGATLKWQTDDFGVVTVKLDQIAAIIKSTRPAAAPKTTDQTSAAESGAARTDSTIPSLLESASPASDTILLTNGDRLNGFVESLTQKQLKLQLETQSVTIDYARIAAIRLANAIKSRPGVYLTQHAGTRLRVSELSVDDATATGLAMGTIRFNVASNKVERIDFNTRHRLMPLHRLPWKVAQGGSVFGVPTPPRFTPGYAALHAPLTLQFQLPDQSARLATTAMIPETALNRADLTLTISIDGRALTTQRLNRQTPSTRINVPASGKMLEIRLDDGADGPVLDRLLLDHPHLLVTIPSDAK